MAGIFEILKTSILGAAYWFVGSALLTKSVQLRPSRNWRILKAIERQTKSLEKLTWWFPEGVSTPKSSILNEVVPNKNHPAMEVPWKPPHPSSALETGSSQCWAKAAGRPGLAPHSRRNHPCFGAKLPTGMQILQLQLRELPKVLMPRPGQMNCFLSNRALRGRPLRRCGPKAKTIWLNKLNTSIDQIYKSFMNFASKRATQRGGPATAFQQLLVCCYGFEQSKDPGLFCTEEIVKILSQSQFFPVLFLNFMVWNSK